MKRIYVLRHPRTHRIRYVGATSYKYLNSRLKVHIAMAVKSTTRVAAWVRQLTDQGLKPTIQAVTTFVADWEQQEKDLIALYRRSGAKILNMADGGRGVLGCRPGAMTRAKRSATLKARYANDPAQMAVRQELARKAARSENGRAAASARMSKIWSDPKLAAQMRARMKGSKARKAASC